MSTKLKPSEIRTALQEKGLIKSEPRLEETVAGPAKSKEESMQNAIAARKAMFKQAPSSSK
jgi:hypothetical protein